MSTYHCKMAEMESCGFMCLLKHKFRFCEDRSLQRHKQPDSSIPKTATTRGLKQAALTGGQGGWQNTRTRLSKHPGMPQIRAFADKLLSAH